MRHLTRWLAGLVLLVASVSIAMHIGEIEGFIVLVRQAEPLWLLVALSLQFSTYVCVAAAWKIALAESGHRVPLLLLVPLSIGKLFSAQVMPSAGMSGNAFFVGALQRRGLPGPDCLAVLLMSLVSSSLAYFPAIALTLLVLWLDHQLHLWILLLTTLFSIVVLSIVLAALWIPTLGRGRARAFLGRFRFTENFLRSISEAPTHLVKNRPLLLKEIGLQGCVVFLDAATLWTMLAAIGEETSYLSVFPAFMLASMAAMISMIPVGLGAFEVVCVSMLSTLAVPVEPALTATLLFRGFAVWLPMLPGMWIARRELGRRSPAAS